MPRKKPVSPTRIIEKSTTAGEVPWYKQSGRPLREAIHKRILPDIVEFEGPRPGEKTVVHTHNNFTGDIIDILPSSIDINTISQGFVRPSVAFQTMVISARKGRKVVGYTFLQINYRQVLKLFKRIGKNPTLRVQFPQPHLYLEYMATEYQRLFAEYRHNPKKQNLQAVKEIQQWLFDNLAMRLRFVPNKKNGYTFENGQFVKKP